MPSSNMSPSNNGSKPTDSPKPESSKAQGESENTEISEKKRLEILRDFETALGSFLIVALKSPMHRSLFVYELETMVLPALSHRQFQIIRHDKSNEPVAFISWAILNEEVETRVKETGMKLKPNEWRCGDRFWLVDVISASGISQKKLLASLVEKGFFKDTTVHALVPNKERGFDSTTLEALVAA